ncbi:MAG: recombinase family protein [Candidatus Peribacteraceae bacterium]|nr:recombinase family protein [Candidatus Peribacteraceae bacterium]
MPKTTINTNDEVHFSLYARKSEESDERQALSIDSQLKELRAVAERDGLNVVATHTEAHSAKMSGQRPVFMQLIEEIKRGVISGILTWLPDRLSRNAGDLGKMVDLMDQGLLREIRTINQVFTGNPNDKFLLMILCSQAKLENDNRGINVKRGQHTRASLGHRPCKTPVGYILDYPAGTQKSRVILDPVRAPIVRKIFRMTEQGMSSRKIRAWLKEIGFTTPLGKQMPLSMIQRMIHNSYYTGRFEWPEKSGKWYKGEYEPLVSKAMFERIQQRISSSARKKINHKNFAFVRMMKCGLCGSGITAQEKTVELKDGSVKHLVYYLCSGGGDSVCKGVTIREDELIKQLSEIMDSVDINDLGLRPHMEAEIARFERFAIHAMGHTPGTEQELPKVTIQMYAKYILRKGTREDKRTLLSNMKGRLILRVYPRVVLENGQ